MLKLICDICQTEVSYMTRMPIYSLEYCNDCANKVEKYKLEMKDALGKSIQPIIRVYVEQLKKEAQAKIAESLQSKEQLRKPWSGDKQSEAEIEYYNAKSDLKSPMPNCATTFPATINDVEAGRAFIDKGALPKGADLSGLPQEERERIQAAPPQAIYKNNLDRTCNMGYYHYVRASSPDRE